MEKIKMIDVYRNSHSIYMMPFDCDDELFEDSYPDYIEFLEKIIDDNRENITIFPRR